MNAGLDAVWDADKNINQEDGSYDVRIENIRTEVKTSFIGNSSPTWQHENISLVPNEYDILALIDIDPTGVYFTFLSYDQIFLEVSSNYNDTRQVYCGKIQPFNLTPTIRKNENNKFKLNFSRTSIGKGMAAGVTFKWDDYNINPVKEWGCIC